MIRRPAKISTERRHEKPLESTGQVLWLVAAVFVATLPHMPFVHLWVPVLVIGIALWRIFAAYTRSSLPSVWIRVPLTLIGFTGILVTYRQVSGVDAGSGLLMVMVAMKLLETRGHRDRAVVIFICYFLLFAAFLREQALWAPLYLFAATLVTTAALLQISRSDEPAQAGRALATAGRLLLQALPLMGLLFLLFPRVPGPFWSLPQSAGAGTTGLSESMSPGDITELALSDKVAFRVRFDGPVPRSADLYWRGPVLGRFDGRRWDRRPTGYLPGLIEQVQSNGDPVDYEITLEPHNRRWLLALETPLRWDVPRAMLDSAFELVSYRPLDRRLSYRARSVLSGEIPGSMPDAAREADTWLPPGSNPRSVDFARNLRANSRSDREFLAAVLGNFREQPFFYSLTPAALGAQSVDEFLFTTREGFCGHYASAFTVLARAAGIPARVVTGYQGGELNPLGNYWLVRQADAHAWAEVWLDGRWQRYDPTAAVAPERIEWGMDAAISRGSVLGADALRDNALTGPLFMSWDAVNAAWNRWVLSFGPDSQAGLLQFAGVANPSTRDLVIALAVTISLCLAGLGWFQYRRQQPQRSALTRAYEQLCKRTAGAARPRRPSEGPLEYGKAVAQLRPDLAAESVGLLSLYARLRYDGAPETEQVERFARAVRHFRPSRRVARASATTAR